jgi:hypothetical protein
VPVNWAQLFRFALEHVLPVAVAGASGYLAGGRRRARADAADAATDQALDAKLRAQPTSEPFNDEPTRPG